MICPDCGQEVPDYSATCNHCGRPFKPGLAMGGGGIIARETAESFVSKKVVAGVCGIVLGMFGVHKFILGLTMPGIVVLLITVLTGCVGGFLVPLVVGIIEGIIYLTKSDQDFYQTYAVEKKGWF